MEALDNTQAQQSRYKDAAAFSMLECMMALQTWMDADKGAWESSYPGEWTTIAEITEGSGGENIIEFPSIQARYVRILCNERINPDWGYSLFSFNVYDGDDNNLALNKTGSVSSMEISAWNCLPMKNAFDEDNSTRWASKGGEDAANTQWIYVDLGSVYNIQKVRLLWENAYATEYKVQAAEVIPPEEPEIEILSYDPVVNAEGQAQTEIRWSNLRPEGYKILVQIDNWNVTPAILHMTEITGLRQTEPKR